MLCCLSMNSKRDNMIQRMSLQLQNRGQYWRKILERPDGPSTETFVDTSALRDVIFVVGKVLDVPLAVLLPEPHKNEDRQWRRRFEGTEKRRPETRYRGKRDFTL